jgi:carbon-monoxide dehydrogenase catalytic subunit
MGPCKINPFGGEPKKGVCGATAETIVARNLLVHIATGSAAHSDHGRDLVSLLKEISLGKVTDYKILDSKKLTRIATEVGIPIDGLSELEIASKTADILMADFGGSYSGGFPFLKRAPEKRRVLWKKLDLIPRGIDREIVEAMHRSHMGVDNDPVSLLLHGIRTALADGWGGSTIATEVSDIIFGTPVPVKSKVNLGVINARMVNIIVHGHEPILSEMLVQAASDNNLEKKAHAAGAEGINICGMCCTGNEILMRHGVPVAGNFLQQELAIITGAVEAMVVDIQCIQPALADLSKCYHTMFISTSKKAHFPGAIRMELSEEHPYETAYQIVEKAVDNFKNRFTSINIPNITSEAMAGFSVESIVNALGGTLKPLLEVIQNGTVRGIAGVVGCNNPKIRHDYGHIAMVRELIKNNVLVVTTGCNAIACAKDGLLTPEAAALAGDGLKAVCNALGIPPVLHMGSCVDISRILTVAGAIANEIGCDISDLPIAGGAPEWMSQKAVSIAAYMLGSGVFTVLGTVPPVLGSVEVSQLLCNDIEGVLGAKFAVEPDPVKAAACMVNHIEQKRATLFSGFKVPDVSIAGD